MESLIDTLLHYSRVGRTEGAIGPTDLDAVLHEVLETLRPGMEERNFEVRVPRPLPRVVCDRARIGEVFQNLVGNALKYNDKSEPWVEVGWCEPQADDSHWTFYVRDNGIGIREKHLDLVFRIFKRLHARDKFGGGTGAGLTIAKKIVEGHHGRIWAESTYGEGSTFYFTLKRSPVRGESA
jgi:light-regulated signal transduction histidine kinase (bacteriophytochrome)